MEAFVITLREGLEAALVVGLIITYLNRTGRTALMRWAYFGLGLAVVASILGAMIFNMIGLDPENEVLEGTLLAIAAIVVVSLVAWMWRTSRGIKQQVEDRLESLTTSGMERRGWGVLVFVFFMVFREGVEMVLFLVALSLAATPDLAGLLGGLSGLGLAALFGVLIIKGSLRINLRRFFGVTSFVLLVLVARLIAGSLHEFFEVGLLPSTPTLLAVIGFIVKDSTSTIILLALIALPVLSMLPDMRIKSQALATRDGENSAERRKRLAGLYRSRTWQTALVSATLATVLLLGITTHGFSKASYRPDPQMVVAHEDGMVHIPVSGLTLGQLNLYTYQGSEEDVTFMVIKRDEDDIAVALNACGICPPVGYHQEGGQLICDNCNAPINIETVGMPGGCNPGPLAATFVKGEVLVASSDLLGAQAVFTR